LGRRSFETRSRQDCDRSFAAQGSRDERRHSARRTVWPPVAARRPIRARLEALVAPQALSPENLSALSIEQLRAAGVSSQKANYLLSLATKVRDGELRLKTIGRLRDENVIEQLVQVKGIGVWTASGRPSASCTAWRICPTRQPACASPSLGVPMHRLPVGIAGGASS
jgi:hypothetical protein